MKISKAGNNMNKKDAIGVFDSGVGGISVLRELKKRMPNENYIYFGDSANAPYGERTLSNICELSKNVAEKLIEKNVKCIIIACNTATSAALEYLTEKFPEIKFIGIEPAVRWACDTLNNPHVLTFATNFTIHKGPKYRESIKECEGRGTFTGIGAPRFVTLVESGVSDRNMSSECREYIDSLLNDVKEPVDALVLGCTHFPFIKDTLKEETDKITGGNARLFDAAVLVAENTYNYLNECGMLIDSTDEGTVTLLNSDESQLELMRMLYEYK